MSLNHRMYTFVLLSAYIVAFGRAYPVEHGDSSISPQGKQGILEIPKQAATIIRGWLDKNLETFLGLTTPPPQAGVPPELQNSVVGNLILGTLTQTIAPPVQYRSTVPSEPANVQPEFISNEPSYNGHSKIVEQTTTKPTPTTPVVVREAETNAIVPETTAQLVGSSNKQRVRTTRTPPKLSALEGDTFNSIYGSYGTLVNTPDEVYWVPDATRPSVIIPIEPSTTQRILSTTDAELSGTDGESNTEPNSVETTTEEDEEGVDEADAKLKKFY